MTMSSGAFAGKVVVVTGGANGIGLACVKRFHADGAKVAALDVEDDALAKLKAELGDARVVPYVVDLKSRTAIVETFKRIEADLGPVDMLVNNAGGTARDRTSEFWCSEPETWDYVIGLCLMATLMCTRQVVPGMRERRSGKIVSIASDSPMRGDPKRCDYSAAKFGIVGFSRSLAKELAPFNVNVNWVAPGPTRTRVVERLPDNMFAKAEAGIPLGRANEPSDIANGVAFLCSEQARNVTGQALVVNGGRHFY